MRGKLTKLSKSYRVLYILKIQIRQDIDNLKKLTEQSEHHLTNDLKELSEQVTDELNGLSEEQREYLDGWYFDDFHCLENVFPNIQRRALFLTVMCMTEANLLLACEMCHGAFNWPKKFKKKKSNERVIKQALIYLENHLNANKKTYDTYWATLNNY